VPNPQRTPQDEMRAVFRWALTRSDLKVDSEKTFRDFFIKHTREKISQPTLWRCLHAKIGKQTEKKIRRGIEAIKREFNPVLIHQEQAAILNRRDAGAHHETALDEIYRGVWSFIQFRVVRQNAQETLPPKQFRAAILVYGDDIRNSRRREVEIYGLTTTWKGSAYQLDNKIYIVAREKLYGHEDAFIICLKAHEADQVPRHEGIVTGVGRSKHDSALIYSCRCLLKKSTELSLDLPQTRQRLIADETFRRAHCRYVDFDKVRKPRGKPGTSEDFVLTTIVDFKNSLKGAPKWIEGERIILQQ
jgi:hypothetical protein